MNFTKEEFVRNFKNCFPLLCCDNAAVNGLKSEKTTNKGNFVLNKQIDSSATKKYEVLARRMPHQRGGNFRGKKLPTKPKLLIFK